MFAHFLCHSANNVFPNFLRNNSFCSSTSLMADGFVIDTFLFCLFILRREPQGMARQR